MNKGLKTLSPDQWNLFQKEGYIIVKGLFSKEDLCRIDHTFDEISNSSIPGYFEPDLEAASGDPLKRYPRVMHPHRFNETAKSYMLHKPVLDVLEDLAWKLYSSLDCH